MPDQKQRKQDVILRSRRYRPYQPIIPRITSGNLYYVRLKTDYGIFYKLGFTSLPSVESRFSYQATGDEQLIDRVLLFTYMEEAFSVETRLHNHFGSKSAFGKYSKNRMYPLTNNGQSELYYNDILELDPAYTKFQSFKTFMQVEHASMLKPVYHPLLAWICLIATYFLVGGVVSAFLPFIWLCGVFCDWLERSNRKVAPPKHQGASDYAIETQEVILRLQAIGLVQAKSECFN